MAARIFRSPPQPQAALAPRASPEVAADSYTTPWDVSDKGYDAAGFIVELTGLNVDPHVAQNTSGRRSAVPDEVAAKAGYATSQRIRKRIEEVFGWMKTVGGMRKLHHRGTALVGWSMRPAS